MPPSRISGRSRALRNCVTLLRVMLASEKGCSAIKQGFIRFDPLMGVELPTLDKSEVVPPTIQEVWKLIDTAAQMESVAYGIIYLGAFTGLRRGEVLALRFDDVDWFQSVLTVNKSLARFPATDEGQRRLEMTNKSVKITGETVQDYVRSKWERAGSAEKIEMAAIRAIS